MSPTLILDTRVLIAGLRSSLGASFALLDLIGSDRFTIGLTAALVLEYEAGGREMNGFVVELPVELQSEVARRANQKPGGESAWVAEAVREKLAACAQLEYLQARAARGSRDAYRQVLGKVPAVEPVPGDERRPPG